MVNLPKFPLPYRPLLLGDSVKEWFSFPFLLRFLIGAGVWLSVQGTADAQEFSTYKGHGGPIMGLDVSPEGQLASASFDNSVGLWTGQEPTWLEGHEAAVVTVNYDQSPALLTGGDDFRVFLWHPDLPGPQHLTEHQGKVADIAVSQDGRRIASAGWDGFVNLSTWGNTPRTAENRDLRSFVTDVLKGHRSNVTSVAFAPGGDLFSASSDGTLRVWEGKGTDLRSRIIAKHGFGINEIIVTDEWIAYGAVDGGTRVIDPEGQEIRDFTLDRRPILAMDYHPGSHQLAVGDGHGYIMMIDTKTWRIARDFRAMRNGPVWALAFSQDGRVIHAGGLEDVIYAWPVALLDQFDPAGGETRDFLRDAASMPNGERQFMRKCSICHALEAGPSRKAGPTLHGVFGRRAGMVEGYRYSATLDGSEIIWSDETIDALFEEGPDHYIPGSKMPMQVIAGQKDRADLVRYLREATKGE